jgi:hypothetical protein
MDIGQFGMLMYPRLSTLTSKWSTFVIHLVADAGGSSPVLLRKNPRAYKKKVWRIVEKSKKDIPEGFTIPTQEVMTKPTVDEEDNLETEEFWVDSDFQHDHIGHRLPMCSSTDDMPNSGASVPLCRQTGKDLDDFWNCNAVKTALETSANSNPCFVPHELRRPPQQSGLAKYSVDSPQHPSHTGIYIPPVFFWHSLSRREQAFQGSVAVLLYTVSWIP